MKFTLSTGILGYAGSLWATGSCWKLREALREAKRELNLPEHTTVTECQTRWGSTQKMTQRVLEQQHALTRVLSTDRKVKQLVPPWQDLDVLESVNKALGPLQDFNDALSAECYVRISYQKPTFSEHLSTAWRGRGHWPNHPQSSILSYLNDKYQATQDLLNITILDPRFRINISAEETIKEQVISEMIKYIDQFLPCTLVL